MKYIKVEWPEIQDYMSNPEYNEECYFDPRKNYWFIPDYWEPDYSNATESWEDEFSGSNIGDLEGYNGDE
jgi:hypothetical protein